MWQKISTASIRNILAIIYISGSFVYIFLLLLKAIPPENKDLVNTLGGVMIGGSVTILGYFFGSSKSSEDKNGSV
jgi:hypothetical protein